MGGLTSQIRVLERAYLTFSNLYYLPSFHFSNRRSAVSNLSKIFLAILITGSHLPRGGSCLLFKISFNDELNDTLVNLFWINGDAIDPEQIHCETSPGCYPTFSESSIYKEVLNQASIELNTNSLYPSNSSLLNDSFSPDFGLPTIPCDHAYSAVIDLVAADNLAFSPYSEFLNQGKFYNDDGLTVTNLPILDNFIQDSISLEPEKSLAESMAILEDLPFEASLDTQLSISPKSQPSTPTSSCSSGQQSSSFVTTNGNMIICSWEGCEKTFYKRTDYL